ncbi:carboxylic ester hydrolase [Aureococcus anophagefferens]|nr:carboxylic ester hydrolase [Aureococcus anophagefferens]
MATRESPRAARVSLVLRGLGHVVMSLSPFATYEALLLRYRALQAIGIEYRDIDAAAHTPTAQNVPYGDDARQVLDVYAPETAKDAPVLVFIHGGCWVGGDKSTVAPLGAAAAKEGVVVVAATHRALPDCAMEAMCDDVAAAFAWTLANVGRFGGDAGRVALGGFSSGSLRGVACVDTGLYDPRLMAEARPRYANLAPNVVPFLHAAAASGAPDFYERVSPAFHAPTAALGSDVSVLVAVSTLHAAANGAQVERFAAALRRRCRRVDVVYSAADHHGVMDGLGDRDDAVFRKLNGFFAALASACTMGGGHEDHGDTVEHAKMKKKKTIRIAHRPDNHESEHPETYWELFYDLILVVVFMRLSAVKYNPSATGYATTVALFLSFWSSWSLLNVYLTKFAADDVLHRFFLAFHVVSSYVAATFLSHVDYEFFDFNHQATYFATATIVNRLGLVGVWAHVAARARHRERFMQDTGLKLLGLGLSIVLFGCTFALNPHVDPKASLRDNFHAAALSGRGRRTRAAATASRWPRRR